MSTYFKPKKSNFTMVSNFALRDTNLSRKAKGLYAEIYSYITIPNFNLSKSYLIKQGLEGESAFNTMWNELKEKGYLKQYRIRSYKNSNGFIYEYELLDKPDLTTPYLINIKIDGSQGAVHNRKASNSEDVEKSTLSKNKNLDFVPPQFYTLYNSHNIQNLGDNNNTDNNNTDNNKEKSTKEKVDSEKQSFPPPSTEKKESVNSQKVVDSFNKTCTSLPQVRSLTDKRKRAIKLILKKYSLKELEMVFKKVEDSDFLNGNSDKWSGATFDWIIKESNFIKVMEGNYDDKIKYNNFYSTPSYDLEGYDNYINDEDYFNSIHRMI